MRHLSKIIDKLVAPQQRKYWEGVEWIVTDGMRRSGKTHLLALAFIQKAIYSDCPVPVWDHHRPTARDIRYRHHLFAEIEKCVCLINEELGSKEQLVLDILPNHPSIRIHLKCSEVIYPYIRME